MSAIGYRGAVTDWQLTIDCRNPQRLVPFWVELLGYEPAPPPDGHETWNDWYRAIGVPDDELDLESDGTDRIVDPTGQGPRIWFQWVPEEKSIKNRLHIDVFVGRDRDVPIDVRRSRVEARVGELEFLGASVVERHDEPIAGHYHVIMADPEGNEFCLV